MILGCFGNEGVDQAGSGVGLCSWSSRFLNSKSCSNFTRPELKDLTLGGWSV